MINKYLFAWLMIVASFALLGCDKLQGNVRYEQSFVNNQLNMSAMAFMESRRDAFSGMLAAIEYVDGDPAFRDVKEMYSTIGNSFLLLHNDALITPTVAQSYWNVNKVMGENPTNPSQTIMVSASDWSQYPRDTVALLLRYHTLKGFHTYETLSSRPVWVETFASTPTNDSALVHLVLENTAAGNLRVNSYVGLPPNYKGVAMGWNNLAPRTPDLRATNGVIHVLNRWFILPTKEAIRNN